MCLREREKGKVRVVVQEEGETKRNKRGDTMTPMKLSATEEMGRKHGSEDDKGMRHLELRHALEPRHGSVAGQNPVQLAVGGHLRTASEG